jgi:hypothetical protein
LKINNRYKEEPDKRRQPSWKPEIWEKLWCPKIWKIFITKLPKQSKVISGEDVNVPIASAKMFVKVEIRTAGPTSERT